MTPSQFKDLRKHLGLSQQEMARALGVSLSSVRLYERGERWDGRAVEIPETVALACAAVALGIRRYSGPSG